MKASIFPRTPAIADVRSPSRLDRMARSAFLRQLSALEDGRLTIRDGLGESEFGQTSARCPFDVNIEVRDLRFYRHVVLDGHLGAAETYMRQYWTCPDVAALVRLMLRNERFLTRLDRGLARLTQPLRFLVHRLRSNTRAGSRRNIVAHYDIGNDFYRLMLDESMTYSCGIFERDDSTLLEASTAKNDRLCRKLALSPSDHVLEIGSGWGGFAIHAARQYGCRVTTTTISKQQFELARERIAREGLTDRITILQKDYRDLQGQYDKLVSIEMIEAVGHEYYETFFRKCGALLKPDGMMAMQAITIPDHLFRRHVKTVDFIRRYIFPGSCIPTITALSNAMARAGDLRLVHLDDITPHYARTLRSWYDNVRGNIDEIRSLGYSDTFLRLWEFYLLYCEGSFAEGYNRDVQMILIRPECRVEPDRFAQAAASRPVAGPADGSS
jgi:cyclopropane-fatty-acyl-phospholipid synthase